VINRKAEKL